MKLLARKQLASKIVLSLTAESILRILLRMYSGMMAYSDVQAYVFATCYKPSVFIELANYAFVNLFTLANDHFNGRLDEMYSIIFTCIVLSDEKFVKVTSKSHLNDGVTSVVF